MKCSVPFYLNNLNSFLTIKNDYCGLSNLIFWLGIIYGPNLVIGYFYPFNFPSKMLFYKYKTLNNFYQIKLTNCLLKTLFLVFLSISPFHPSFVNCASDITSPTTIALRSKAITKIKTSVVIRVVNAFLQYYLVMLRHFYRINNCLIVWIHFQWTFIRGRTQPQCKMVVNFEGHIWKLLLDWI